MIRHIIALVSLVCCIVASTAGAMAERRLALLIGINDYEHIPRLEKAVGDVNAMARKLEALNFDVTKVINPDRRSLNIALGRFAARLGPNDLAFLHFSGHGVEIDGDNFLLPRDIPKPVNNQRDTVKYEAIGLRRLISQLNSTGARARVFVIDACRDNPFEQSGVRSVGASRGLARVEAPAGNFIMYSAGYRQMALDKLGPEDDSETSVYTRVLLTKLDQPGLPLAKIAREVRSEVQSIAQGIGHVQRPAYYDELSSSLVLVPEGAKKTIAAPAKPAPVVASLTPAVAPTSDKQIELLYWNEVRTSQDPAILQSYLSQYPTGSFAPLAKLRILALKNAKAKEEAAAKKPKPVAQEQKVAKLNNPTSDATQQPTDEQRAIQPVAVPVLTYREMVMGIQRNLKRLGCSAGSVDGAWGPNSRRALRRYARHNQIRLASLEPSQDVLDDLEVLEQRVCPIQCGRGETLSNGQCVVKKKPRTKKARVAPQEPVHRKSRSRAERRKKIKKQRTRERTKRTKKRKAETRVRVLKKNRRAKVRVEVNKRGPKRRKKVCADRERSLCQWDN